MTANLCDEKLSIGLDVGIGSIGCAAITENAIDALHVRCFKVPETPKDKKLLNALRRGHRLLRTQTSRRRKRRNTLAKLLSNGLEVPIEAIKRRDQHDPWTMRAEGLTRLLTPVEFASAILHVAKRRGFKSNSKSDRSGNDAETGKVLSAVEAMKVKAATYETVGLMLATDTDFVAKKRNRSGDYSHTIPRAETEREIRKLFQAQRRLSQTWATSELEESVLETALYQRPLQSSEHLVGSCPFEDGEKRASKLAPSFERFRYLSKLVTLRIISGSAPPRSLSRDELSKAASLFGKTSKITYKAVRKTIALPEIAAFEGVPREKPANRSLYEGADVSASRGSCAGTYAISRVLAPLVGKIGWQKLLVETETLDRVAAKITFREEVRATQNSQSSIEIGFQEQQIPEDWVEPLLTAIEEGVFREFSGAGHVSALAARRISPYLAQGKVYSEACAEVGYDHSEQRVPRLNDITNPVVRKSVAESWRLLQAVIRKLGRLPGRITVEMARDVGKPVEVRNAITKYNLERESTRKEGRQQYLELVGKEPTNDELLAFELWREQNHICLYSGTTISPAQLDLSKKELEVDHALPRSRSQDSSYQNKVLCLITMNQQKGNRTPHEWLTSEASPDALSWDEYEAWVERLTQMKGIKKRNLLMRDFASREEQFVSRNLNDTRYAARVLRALCETLYVDETPDEQGRRRRRVFTRPGALVAGVRRVWGLERLKKNIDGGREGDLHHAVDAACIAALGNDEGLTQRLTRIYQSLESKGISTRNKDPIEPPWPNFREDVEQAVARVHVSRSEERKTTGEGHQATIRRVKASIDGDGNRHRRVFERKDIMKVTAKDLDRLDPIRQVHLKTAVADWLDQDKKTRLPFPRMPTLAGSLGPEIRKLRLPISMNAGVMVRGGIAGNGDMVRVDVFRDTRGYWLVPVYTHQINAPSKCPIPPNRACVAGKAEEDWEVMKEEAFIFSLYSWSLVEAVKSNGDVIRGYFRLLDRANAGITISDHASSVVESQTRTGTKTLKSFRKFRVDILGNLHNKEQEVRRWPGVASI